ncbi:hypothetical protein O4002_00800 [Providencia stuartii]|nr:hypothetical protein [Providencia stuartii]WAZ82908.1 hypothetical protein O4002_00800 [Providencia stuartii]
MKVGTSDFDISKVDTSQPLDELLMFTVAQYLLKDWQGVGELNAKGEQVAIEYTPERGTRLLKQCPDIYWKVIDAAVELSKEESEQIDETIKKVIEAQKWLTEFGGERSEKAKWKRKQLGLPDVPAPDFDGVTNELLMAYSIICRSRRYAGMDAYPLPISLADIDQYLASRPTALSRREFDAAIFALDDNFRAEWMKEQERKDKK